ncbi:MAG: AAA family ATPase [Candidatus Limnocylindrales bacterium]
MIGGQSGSVSSPVMVGREAESERIGRALAALTMGGAPPIIISGEAGIGKTRLIDESLGKSADDLRVLRAECLALGSRIPYLPFAELLRSLVYQVPALKLASIIGPARDDLVSLLPELEAAAGRSAADGAPRRRGRDELDRLRLYESFLQVSERIAADRPTVFVIEDVQWIDRASLELLAFLANGRRPENPSGLIISVRPESIEDKPEVLQLLADLGHGGLSERIELNPLDEGSTRRLMTAVMGKPARTDLARRIHELSSGNPLFAEELLAAASSGDDGATLPPRLRDLLSARLAAVPDEVLAVLRIAAAAGHTIDDGLLGSVGGLDEDHVRSAVRAAVDDHILVRTTASSRPAYRFRHEVMRSLVASKLLPAEAAHIHAAFARALADEPPERQNATEIADHWDAAGDRERALVAHLAAGDRATETYAFESARAHYERALVLWDEVRTAEAITGWTRVAIMDHAASTSARVGDFERATELTRAVMGDRAHIDVETFELARSSLRWYLWESGDIAAGLVEARAVVDDDAPMPDRWRANALGHLAGLLLYDRHTREAAELAVRARDAAAAAGAVEEQILAEGILGWCLLLEGDVSAGLDAIRGVVEMTETIEGGALEGRYPVGPALAHAHLAGALELVGRFDEAHAVAAAGAEVAERQGVARTFGSALRAIAARALYQLGRWSEAESLATGAMEGGAVGQGRIGLLAVRARLAIVRGEDEVAERTLRDADEQVGEATPLDVRRWLAAAQAERAIWDGRPGDALERLAILADEPEAGSITKPSGPPAIVDASIPQLLALGARAASDLALQERAAGTAEGFAALVDQQLRAALDRVRRRKALAEVWAGDLAIARAELERAQGGPASRARRWRAAAEGVAGRAYTSAYVGWRLAEAELADRDGRAAAAPIIEHALGIAASLGARPLREELQSLARRARLAVTMETEGPTVTASADERPFGLTVRELEVLALLADGMGNREIAERLYISPKTASVHVSNIYGKLGVESRVAAATTAHSLGLVRTGTSSQGGRD